MEFKDKVKYVRKKLYLSQEMMAKELSVAFATVNRWESGRCEPNYRSQKAFAEFCKSNNLSVEELDKMQFLATFAIETLPIFGIVKAKFL